MLGTLEQGDIDLSIRYAKEKWTIRARQTPTCIWKTRFYLGPFVEDAFDKLQDPDFELDLDIDDDQKDSDEEIPVGGFNFSVAGEGIKTDSDTDESESETDGLDESGEEDYERSRRIKRVSLWII